MDENLQQTATLQVTTGAELGGLDLTLSKLKAIDAVLDRIYSKANGRATPRTADVFGAQITGKDLGVDTIAKQFGMDPASIHAAGITAEREVRKTMNNLRSEVKKKAPGGAGEAAVKAKLDELKRQLYFTSEAGSAFTSRDQAARLLAEVEKVSAARHRSAFKQIFGAAPQQGGPADVPGGKAQVPGTQVTATVAGAIGLNIPAAQIEARVVGPVQLAIPGAQVQAGVAGAVPPSTVAAAAAAPAAGVPPLVFPGAPDAVQKKLNALAEQAARASIATTPKERSMANMYRGKADKLIMGNFDKAHWDASLDQWREQVRRLRGGAPVTPGKHIAEQFSLPITPTPPAAPPPGAVPPVKPPAGGGGAGSGGGSSGGGLTDVKHLIKLEKEEGKRALAAASTDLHARSAALDKTAKQMRAVLAQAAPEHEGSEAFERFAREQQAVSRTYEAQARAIKQAAMLEQPGGGLRGATKAEIDHLAKMNRAELTRALSLTTKDSAGRAEAYERAATGMRTLATTQAAQLDPEIRSRLVESLEARARIYDARAMAARLAAQNPAAPSVTPPPAPAAPPPPRAIRVLGPGTYAQQLPGGAMRITAAPTPPRLPPVLGGVPPAPSAPPGGVAKFWNSLFGPGGRLVTRGLTGFTPTGFAKNIATVGGWTAAVGTLYAGIGLVTRSVQSFAKLERSTQRLDQVFRGGGGSARQLADDVLRLASVNGRSADEAIESAIAWSRTGMNRVEVNKAVKVSLMAANVAEMTAGESTEALSAIMASYSLNADQLNDVLGEVNHTSNTLRVTNKDLFEGLARTANIARQMRLPLEDLIPIIGTAVAATGQSGAQFGNAMKTVLTRLATPDIQEYLRATPIGVEVRTADGGLRDAKDILADLAERYKTLGGQDQALLVAKVGRATQANRLVTFLQQWDRSMLQSADNLKNLNSAQEENAKITSSLDSKWKGFTTAWDRLVLSSGYGPAQAGKVLLDDYTKVFNLASDIAILTAPSPAASVRELKIRKYVMQAGNEILRQTLSPIRRTSAIGFAIDGVNSMVQWRLRKREEAQAPQRRKEMEDAARAEAENLEGEAFSRMYVDTLNRARSMFATGGMADQLALQRSALATAQEQMDLPPEVQAQLAALSNPKLTSLARLADRRALASGITRLDALGMAFGETEGEALTNQRAGILQEMDRLSELGQTRELTDNEIVRQLTLQLSLLENQEAIQNRIVQVEAERRQIQLESSREFQRSLLSAGPGDLLRKLSVNQMWSQGRIGPHNFFALAPEARADADLLMGGEAMRRNRRDAALLGPGQTVEQRQSVVERMTEIFGQMREQLDTEETGVLARAVAAMEGLDRVGAAANRAAQSMDVLAEKILKRWDDAREAPPQAGGSAPGVSVSVSW